MTNHETVKHLRDAQRRLRSVLVANADRLSTPFTDDPSKNPWDTYLRPAVRGLQEAVNAACEALAAPAAVSVPPPAPQAAARRERYAAALAEGFRAFDADTTSDAYLDAELLDAVVAVADAEEAELLAAVPVVPPATRADALREAADIAEEVAESLRKHHEFERSTGALDVMTELRRLADEPPTATKPEACPTPESHNWGCGCPGDRLPLYSDRGVDTPGCDCGHNGMGMRWHSEACLWIGGLLAEARELLSKPEPAAEAAVSGPCVAGEQQNETPEAAPCDVPNGCEDGELCATHEEQQAHAEGEHAFCGVTCEVAMPTELMRNSLIAWAPPGGKGILAELERRAAAATAVVAQPGKEN